MNIIFGLLIVGQLATPYESRIIADDEGRYLVYARYYQGELVSIDSIKPIEQYFGEDLLSRNRSLLLKELKLELKQQSGYASQGIFGTFEIPLPKGGFSEFMGETGKLDVGGHVKISLGGSQTFIPTDVDQSFWPELEMKQEVAVKLDGQVGDRMRVFIDHDSERLSETQNKITVTYKGREDEVIQEIEGGDTQLAIPATNYTGDIPSHTGLFGIKSQAKFGPLDLVAIASKEQTQSQEIEILGGVQADTTIIWAKNYIRRRFFSLGLQPGDTLTELEVYIDDRNAQNNKTSFTGITFYGNAYLDRDDDNIPDDQQNPTNRHTNGYFTLMREGFGDDYVYVPYAEGSLELSYALSTTPVGHVLGVYYTKRNNGVVDTVGRKPSAGDTTITLKLICPEQMDTLSYTYYYEKRNYYQILNPGSKLDSLRIYYVNPGVEPQDRQNDTSYIQILGLDQNLDGLVDENTAFLSGQGLLRFPDPEPFADSSKLNDPDPEIYNNPYMIPNGKYYLFVKTIGAKARYELPENAEGVWVYLNDVLQDSLVDYHIDRVQGFIEFRKPILPSQKVRIKVEYAPWISMAQKSLVGVRGSLRPFGDAVLGSSFLHRTESYPAEHIRLREEPFNRSVWEVDFNYPQDLPFITRVIDRLPLIQTEAASRFLISCEGAFSFSNLNAKEEVYLDDLESSTIISNDFSIGRTVWVPASKPVSKDTLAFARQHLIWYNPRTNDERIQDSVIYENPLEPANSAEILKIYYRPDSAGSFAGLTQYIYSENFEEIENLEMIIKGNGGRIHVDFAQRISEDQLRRDRNGNLLGFGEANDEDQNPRNSIWTEYDEDTGLDGVAGDDDDNIAGDAGNDDYNLDDKNRINGTEGNRLWDTEDIDRDGSVSQENRYFSFSIDLDDTTSNRFVRESGLHNGWKLFRVAIKDSLEADTVVGQPDWRSIQFVRIWFDGFAQSETIQIYKLSATGSRWKNYGIVGKQPPMPSMVFNMIPVNTRTHTYYRSPYPVEKDEYGRVKTEGGLELRVENIQKNFTCVAHRRTDENEDYRAYDTLTFYLNARNSNPIIGLRFGTDSLNYYEYRAEYSTATLGLNDYRLFKVAVQRFIDLKRNRSGTNDTTTVTDGFYTVVGRPSLSRNQFFELRITNQFTTPLTDTIWFNDIKLDIPRREVGRIFRGNGSFNLADLASFTVAYDESNGRFRRLSEPKDLSTQAAGQSFSANSTISLNKFLPTKWGISLPLNLSYRNSLNKPRFSYFADDMEIEGDDQFKQRTSSTQRSYSINVSKSGSKHWLLKKTIDNMSFGHDRSQSFTQSVTSLDSTDIIGYRGGYTLEPGFTFRLFKEQLTPLPKTVAFTAAYSDNSVKTYYRSDPDSDFKSVDAGIQRRKTLTPSVTINYIPHNILNASYTFTQIRDSVTARGRFGEEVGRNQSFNGEITKDLYLISPRFNYNSNYNEDYRFEIRKDEDLRNVSNNGQYTIGSEFRLNKLMRMFTGLRDRSKDSLLVAGSPAWVLKQIETITSYIQNPRFDYSRQRSSSYLNVIGRPDYNYQWGLIDSIPSDMVAPGSYPGRSMTESYGASSGLNHRYFTVTGRYSRSINSSFTYDGSEMRNISTRYPEMNFRLLRLESLPMFKKALRSSSVMVSYNQTMEARYEINGDTVEKTSDSKGITWQPLASWQATWSKGFSTTIEVNYSLTNSNQYIDTIAVPSRNTSQGGSVSFAYTFSAPTGLGIPLLKGVKFSSNLSVNASANYNRSMSYSGDLTTPVSDLSTTSFLLGLSYNFSSFVTGGANFDYSQNDDRNTEQDTRKVGLDIWVNINF